MWTQPEAKTSRGADGNASEALRFSRNASLFAKIRIFIIAYLINSAFLQIVLTRPMDLSAADAGTYAAVLINPNGEVFTFGDTASDGQRHVKVLGDNTFSFKDLLASQGSDWNFNDFRIQLTLA